MTRMTRIGVRMIAVGLAFAVLGYLVGALGSGSVNGVQDASAPTFVNPLSVGLVLAGGAVALVGALRRRDRD